MAESSSAELTEELPQMTQNEYLKSTFEREKSHHMLSDVNLTFNCPLDDLVPHSEPQCDLGVLDKLPLELQQAVFAQVDLRTLFDFRRVNRRALQIVDSIPEYRNVIKHAPNALRAVLSIGTGSYTTCLDLWATLTTSACTDCGDFGGFIYLPTCQRICFLCNFDKKKYFPLTPHEVGRRFGITLAAANDLPKMRSVPGEYSSTQRTYRTRVTLVDREVAHQAGLAHHGSEDAIEDHVKTNQERLWAKYNTRKVRDAVNGGNTKVRRPTYIEPPDRRQDNARRFMAIIRAPFINKASMTAEEGRHCRGCADSKEWRRLFALEAFNEHVAKEGPIGTNAYRRVSHMP